MGHASDCAVNDGPAFLAGPCDCGLELDVDPFELFRPLAVIGARRGRWEVRQRNVEALVKAHETPIPHGFRIALSVDLKDTHGWPVGSGNANRVDLYNAGELVVGQPETHPHRQRLPRNLSIGLSAIEVLRLLYGNLRRSLWLHAPRAKNWFSHGAYPRAETATQGSTSPTLSRLANLAGYLRQLRRRVDQSADKSGGDPRHL